MKYILNGKIENLNNIKTIEDVILSKNINSKLFIIEKNSKIINKKDYKTTKIENGDKVEIIGFAQGG